MPQLTAEDIEMIRTALVVYRRDCLLLYHAAETPAEREKWLITREAAAALYERLSDA